MFEHINGFADYDPSFDGVICVRIPEMDLSEIKADLLATINIYKMHIVEIDDKVFMRYCNIDPEKEITKLKEKLNEVLDDTDLMNQLNNLNDQTQ
jgi:hypothetical protein